jgi:CRP-like cAMP-binding protein
MIGASRETVTRLFASFKQKSFIEVRGSSLVVKNRKALQDLLEA